MKLKRLRESRGDGLVGIWWYTDDNQVIGVRKSVNQGYQDSEYVQYDNSSSHLSLWSKVIKSVYGNTKQANDIINQRYMSLERGRVIYNLLTRTYIVTCSNVIVNNIDFRQAIIKFYNLQNDRVDFTPLEHYNKVELTGNPALDNFMYGEY